MLPTFLRETRATVARLKRSPATPTRSSATCAAPADDLGPTLRDLAALSPDLEHLFRAVGPLVDASRDRGAGRRAPARGGAAARSSRLTCSCPSSTRSLAYLAFSREQLATFLAPGRLRARRERDRRLSAERQLRRALPAAVGDHRLALAPAADQPTRLGARELLLGAERVGALHRARRHRGLRLRPGRWRAAQPVRVGHRRRRRPASWRRRLLFQDQRYPRLRRGHAPLVSPPAGRAPGQLAGTSLTCRVRHPLTL